MMSAAQVTSPPSPGTEPTDLTGSLLRYLDFAFKLGKDQSDRSGLVGHASVPCFDLRSWGEP